MKGHVKRLMSLSLFMVLIFSGVSGLLAEEAVPVEVLQAAREGIGDFAGAGSALPDSLFSVSKAALDNAGLNHGFRVFTVPPAALVKSSDLASIIAPTGMWRFVVVLEGKPVSLITVARVGDGWKAVSLGGVQLAEEVNKIMERWPAQSGYSHRFIRIYQARADFMEISRNGRSIGFVPLTASRVAFEMGGEFDAGVILPDSEILNPLQEIVSGKMSNIENQE
jgi:hypothetical protein